MASDSKGKELYLTFKTLESQQIDPEMSGSLNKNAEIINT